MKALIRRVTVSRSFGFQYNKLSSICNASGLADCTLLTVAVLALTCSALPALARSENQGAAVNVLEDNPNRIVVSYEFGDFKRQPVRIDGQSFTEIYLEGESNKKEKGAPALPDASRSIIIPDDARMAVRVLDSSYYEIEDIDIVPSKGYIPRSVNPADVPYTFGRAYKTNAFYPGPLAVLREPYIMRDHRGIVVTANPFQYNPVRRVLRVYTNMTVEVAAVGLGKVNVLYRKPRKLSRAFHQLYSSHFINYELNQRYTLLDEQGEMLIIVGDCNWISNVQPLKVHKDSIGIPTTVVCVSTIGNNCTDIKDYIQSVYDSATDLAFVLLVGDYTQVETCTQHYDDGWTEYPDSAIDPSYSLVAGSDNYPDIMVGRFSAETPADVDTQVERTIEYENMPATQQCWFWRAVMIASDQGPGHNGEYDCQHKQLIREDLLACGYIQVDELYDGSLCGDAAGDPDPQDVADCINAGRGFINYIGHGNTTFWGTSGFNNTNVNALTNDNMLPFIFDVACLNGQFNGYTCFAEAWLRATNGSEPTGAIGIYASSITSPWDQPMDADDEFVDLFCAGTYSCFGTLCYAGSCSMMDNDSGNILTWGTGPATFNTWHIFGDPSLRIVGDDGPNTPPVACDSSVSTEVNTPVNIILQAIDEGHPDPLSYIIASLPSYGVLSDPFDENEVNSVSYTLLGYGNEVLYTPAACQMGSDSFKFKANDGGTAPDGGDSNIATVTVEVQAGEIVIYETGFDSGLPTGWSIINGGSSLDTWMSENPGGRWSSYWTGIFMIVDSDWAGLEDMNEQLITQSFDCSGFTDVTLKFKHYFCYYSPDEVGDVDVRIDGGAWQNLARYQGYDYEGQVELPLSGYGADGASDVQIRWHYYNANYDWYWGIDDVEITVVAAAPVPPVGDFNRDCRVDYHDLAALCDQWLFDEIPADCAPAGGDGVVNFADFSVLAPRWPTEFNFSDLAEFADQWLKAGLAYCIADIAPEHTGDGSVNALDFATLAQNWLIDCIANPSDPACVPK